MIFKKIYIYHCIERTEHVLEVLDIGAIKVYVYYYYYIHVHVSYIYHESIMVGKEVDILRGGGG